MSDDTGDDHDTDDHDTDDNDANRVLDEARRKLGDLLSERYPVRITFRDKKPERREQERTTKRVGTKR